MELKEGDFWRRKLTGFIWEIQAINPGGTVAIKLWDEIPNHELLTREDFLEKFEPNIR